MSAPVVIYKTFSAADAHLVRSCLESSGIPVDVTGELAGLSMEGYSLATGGIRVVVPPEFEAQAREILKAEPFAGPLEEGEDEQPG